MIVDVVSSTESGFEVRVEIPDTACSVPDITGRSVAAARKALAAANCTLGKVRGKGRRIVGQTQAAGIVLPADGPVGARRGRRG